MPNGSYFLNQEIVDRRNIPLDYIQEQASAQAKEIERRLTSAEVPKNMTMNLMVKLLY